MKTLIDAVLAMAVRAMDPHGNSSISRIEWMPSSTGTEDWRGLIVITYK